MVRHSDFKRRYDQEIGKYVKKHVYSGEIYGEGLTDIFKSIGSKLFGKTAKEMTKKGLKTASAVVETGEFVGNKAGDKIVQLLQKKQSKQQTVQPTISQPVDQPLTDFEIAQRVNQIISGGKIRRNVKFI